MNIRIIYVHYCSNICSLLQFQVNLAINASLLYFYQWVSLDKVFRKKTVKLQILWGVNFGFCAELVNTRNFGIIEKIFIYFSSLQWDFFFKFEK